MKHVAELQLMRYIIRLYTKSPTTEWASENQQIRYIECAVSDADNIFWRNVEITFDSMLTVNR